MSQDEGASTDVTGTSVSCRACIIALNGSLTSPEKLNPRMQEPPVSSDKAGGRSRGRRRKKTEIYRSEEMKWGG